MRKYWSRFKKNSKSVPVIGGSRYRDYTVADYSYHTCFQLSHPFPPVSHPFPPVSHPFPPVSNPFLSVYRFRVFEGDSVQNSVGRRAGLYCSRLVDMMNDDAPQYIRRSSSYISSASYGYVYSCSAHNSAYSSAVFLPRPNISELWEEEILENSIWYPV